MIFLFFTVFKASISVLKENKKNSLDFAGKPSTNYFVYRGYKLPTVYRSNGSKILESSFVYDNGNLKVYDPNFKKVTGEYIKYNSILIECFYEQNKKVYLAYDRSPPNVCDKNFKKIIGAYIKYNNGIPCAFYQNGTKVLNPYFTYNTSILKIYRRDSREIKDFKIIYNTEKNFTIYDHNNNPIENAILTYENTFLSVNSENIQVSGAYISFHVEISPKSYVRYVKTKSSPNICISCLKDDLTINISREMLILEPTGINENIISNIFISYAEYKSVIKSLDIKYNSNFIPNDDAIYKSALSYDRKIKINCDEYIKNNLKQYNINRKSINGFISCMNFISESDIDYSKKIINEINRKSIEMNPKNKNLKRITNEHSKINSYCPQQMPNPGMSYNPLYIIWCLVYLLWSRLWVLVFEPLLLL